MYQRRGAGPVVGRWRFPRLPRRTGRFSGRHEPVTRLAQRWRRPL